MMGIKELLDRKAGIGFKEAIVRPWLNWIEHLTTDQKVRGSNPLGRAITFASCGWLFFFLYKDKY
jgi:hypothetical protein